jgi:predicted nucleotidyltransferase
MKFHGHLEQLFGSRVSIRIIRTLVNYSGKVFTVRKLAEEAGVSSSEAALIVQQLEKQGIVRLQPVGRSYLVSLNEKSYVLNKILRPIVQAEKATLGELVSILRRDLSSDNIVSAVIFGSVARMNEREDSDIDVLVVSNDFDSASEAVARVLEEVSLIFHNRLSPLILSEEELRTKKDGRLVRSILEKYIVVAGRDLKELVDE